jgi:[Skp1-protein]-hydroxyproline N-acetylglucosaminyltransferase
MKSTSLLNVILWGICVCLTTVIIGIVLSRCGEKFLNEHFGSECLDFIPFQHVQQIPKKINTIFVSIASYRDNECGSTLEFIYKNADNPTGVFVGICEQNKDGETSELCITGQKSIILENIRVHKFDYRDAKGPTYARYFCSKLWNGEEYFLQIDSHTKFEPHWDTELINMILSIKSDPNESDMPVLSTYPPTDKQMSIDGFPEMDSAIIRDSGVMSFYCGWSRPSDKPRRSNKPWAAAGFMFLESDFLYSVPFDPNLSHLFQGEEVLFSARLFTNGYDFYVPNKKLLTHHYNRDGPIFHKDSPKISSDCRANAEKRMLFLLGIKSNTDGILTDFLRDMHNYGLGNFRSINDFWMASGADINTKTVEKWNDSNVPTSKYDGWWFRRDGFKNIKKYTN